MKKHYIKAIQYVAIGYLIILIDVNIYNLNLLPQWFGYILLYQAMKWIKEYEKSTKLLFPLAIILGTYEFLRWFCLIFNVSFEFYILHVIISSLALYFDFQLLTNIADIASNQQYPKVNKIYWLRNIKTIFLTLTVLPISWEQNHITTILLTVMYLLVAFSICFVLFHYVSYLKNHE